MTDSSKSQKPTSPTQGVGFQKLDNQAESGSQSSTSEQSAKPTDAKKPEPEVPTESISISPVTADEPVKAEAKPAEPPKPEPEPVKAEAKPAEPPKPEPEPVKADVKPEVPATPEPPKPAPEPVKADIKPEVPVTSKPPEPKPEPVSATQPAVQPKLEPINVVKPPAEIKMEPTTAPSVPVIVVEEPAIVETSQFDVQVIKDKVLYWISDLPENLREFFGEYQRPLLTVVGIVVIMVTAKGLVGVLDSINDVPLVKSTLEIVGIGYSGWFIYRYLLRAETRQELLAKLQSFKDEVVGKDS
jgi:glutamyl-tRNA synthetase